MYWDVETQEDGSEVFVRRDIATEAAALRRVASKAMATTGNEAMRRWASIAMVYMDLAVELDHEVDQLIAENERLKLALAAKAEEAPSLV